MIALAQTGIYINNSQTYEHSLIVLPFGKVLVDDRKETVINLKIDLDRVK